MSGLILALLLSQASAESWRDSLKGNSGRIETNQVVMAQPPKWLNARRVQRVIDSIQGKLEWEIRKVTVHWYTDAKAFQKAHGLGPGVRGAAKKADHSIHLGPLVNDANFDGVFGHELAHVILFQKYKDAIPPWLEEGLANQVSRKDPLNYKALAAKPFRPVTQLGHPFRGDADPDYVYLASTAVMRMIAEKCSLTDLLQLSVGRKLESYLKTYCEISDLDSTFRDWVQKKARAGERTK